MSQQQLYTFPCVEPIHTFLLELPRLDDKLLYEISLLREPRQAALQNQPSLT